MPSNDRRAEGRRRAWGRGPIILRFEPLEGRQLMTASGMPDLVGSTINALPHLNWGDTFQVSGQVRNQGRGTANQSYSIAVYASATPVLTGKAVKIGEITMPAGLAGGQTADYSQSFTLPATSIPQFNGKLIYIDTWVDRGHTVKESNYHDNYDVGLNHDVTPVLIAANQPSNLIGTALGVSQPTALWGQQVTVAAQIHNDAQGDAPATVARLVLSPASKGPGLAFDDVTVGYINVPAIPAWQTVNVEATITLPTVIPNPLVGTSLYVLSMIQDSNYVTNPLYPHGPSQGPGQDQVPIAINADTTTTTATSGAEADLAVGTVKAPSTPVFWGQNFSVTTTVQNIGSVGTGGFNVEFIMTGASGSTSQGIYLGETTISGVPAGGSVIINPTLSLPAALPNGIALSSVGVGQVAAIVDPDDLVNEPLKTNNVSESNPVTLRVLGTDGTSTVPTLPAIDLTPGPVTTAGTLTKIHRAAAHPAHPRILHRHSATKKDFKDQVQHDLKVFPDQVTTFVKNLFKGKL